jgi:NAD(P)-dependent dehydrogenase (short-subunit alcohol dehydrogenase family)
VSEGALAGRVALVTGAAGGIGRAICLRFAAEGAAVVAADLDPDGAAETAGLVAESGGRAAGTGCDVSDEAAAEAAVALARERFGGLGVLVNNAAAFLADTPVTGIAPRDWRRALDVNVTGAFLMSRAAIPAMVAGGGGSIVHVASQLGQVAHPGRTWYGAAKAALIHLAKGMAVDHAADGIRVNSLSPGPVETRRVLMRDGDPDATRRAYGDRTLLGRLGRVEEVAEAALFLASDRSSFMTGADLLVDGGYVVR